MFVCASLCTHMCTDYAHLGIEDARVCTVYTGCVQRFDPSVHTSAHTREESMRNVKGMIKYIVRFYAFLVIFSLLFCSSAANVASTPDLVGSKAIIF